MTSYLSVFIQERDISNNKLDTSIIIIYDSREENFYLYGPRDNYKFQPYSYTYHYSEINQLCHFVKLIIKHSISKFSVSYNNIFIPNEDLEYIDFYYLRNKIDRNNEIIAFDMMKFKEIHLKQNLIKLFCIDEYL